MKRILIAGATGMIGSLILQRCLDAPETAAVVSLVRKPGPVHHPRLKEVLYARFEDLAHLEEPFTNVDVAFFCVGAYTGSVPDEQLRKVTVDYACIFADRLKENSPQAVLCFLSGQGADRKEKSSFSFARYKGIAENHLLSKSFASLYIFRPAYIYPVTPRKEPNFSYRLMRILYPVIRLFGKSMSVRSDQLADAMFRAGYFGCDKNTLENRDILNSLPA